MVLVADRLSAMNVGAAFSIITSLNYYSPRHYFSSLAAMTMKSKSCLSTFHVEDPARSAALSCTSRTYSKKSGKGALELEDVSSTLSRLTMSPERYAASLNMTTQQVDEAIEARKAASTALDQRLTTFEEENGSILSAEEIGRMKHRMICRHRYDHMRKPFVCRKCWTDIPICVCPLFDAKESTINQSTADDIGKEHKATLPKGVERVVVWTHHDEWGRTANTGSLLPLGLERTELLMKGLDEHDAIMNEIIDSEDVLPVVLWPGKGTDEDIRTISLPELRGLLGSDAASHTLEPNNDVEDTQRCVLITIEGTWNNARKMANKLPSKVLRLDLGDEIAASFSSPTKYQGIFFDPNYDTNASPTSTSFVSPSLLAPLRRQGRGNTHNRGKMENVSTLEATLVALVGMGLRTEDAGHILWIARTKVDRILDYSGKYHAKNWY